MVKSAENKGNGGATREDRTPDLVITNDAKTPENSGLESNRVNFCDSERMIIKDSTEKLKKIAASCKAAVSLDYRMLSSYYEKIKDEVAYAAEDEGSHYLHVSNFLDGELDKCLETDEYWHLQFYPSTPIGFHAAFSHDLDKLLDWALEILNDH